MGLGNLFSYQIRAAEFTKVYSRGSKSIVVFMHGILSDCQSAFRVGEDKFFWDELSNRNPFVDFDIATFNYGFFDVSKLTELANPYNSLDVLTNELHGALLGYDHIMLIGHSQGGLLAREYVCKYHGHTHPCVLITLHSPHKNKSLYVKRLKNPLQWPSQYSFRVPHIVAGSVNDKYFAKVDNIEPYARYESYISHDVSKLSLGHGHLSQDPDNALLEKISTIAHDFVCSGFTRIGYNPRLQSLAQGEIFYSKSKRRLEEFTTSNSSLIRNIRSKNAWTNSQNLAVNACSVGNIVRRMSHEINKEPAVVDLDYFYDENLSTANDRLCAINSSGGSNANPYSDIPFDVSQFKKRSLVTNPDFLLLLNDYCKKRGVSIRSTNHAVDATSVKNAKLAFHQCYVDTIKQLKEQIASELYGQCKNGNKPNKFGIVGFEQYLMDVVSDIQSRDQSQFHYTTIYEVVFKLANQRGYEFVLDHIEKVISRIARSDGELYWLDKDLALIYKKGEPSSQSFLSF